MQSEKITYSIKVIEANNPFQAVQEGEWSRHPGSAAVGYRLGVTQRCYDQLGRAEPFVRLGAELLRIRRALSATYQSCGAVECCACGARTESLQAELLTGRVAGSCGSFPAWWRVYESGADRIGVCGSGPSLFLECLWMGVSAGMVAV